MTATSSADPRRLADFVELVVASGREHYRDFAWRHTSDPYQVLVSEVMLQQTQAARVVRFYEEWLGAFPSLEALAAAPLEAVLRAWQGLGYNRRAVALKRLADQVVDDRVARGWTGAAELPADEEALRALPGVGPATAAGVLAFAYDRHATYLETNVRAVVLHELLADRDGVPDREISALVSQAAQAAEAAGITARTWNYALLDHGAHLKRTLPNPSRRSAHHARQSPFQGSRRQKRARLLKAVLAQPGGDEAQLAEETGVSVDETRELLTALEADGFLCRRSDGWSVA
ncbi:MAG: adenine glycosylase [Coriobacteriia bacterium]|nr:adenine glycosylase [Coriobacteriia bacterium]